MDPGETVDKPLVYEAGWGKKLTYVIAFSKEEVQDVTWRYSKNHEDTRARRSLVRPRWLVTTILELTRRRMETRGLTPDQRRSLTERRLAECLELLTPRSVTSGDQVGRQTGSLAWRLARGELGQTTTDTQWVWEPSEADLEAGMMSLEYSVVEDVYRTGAGAREGFMSGLWSGRNLARKVETDWNMAYIARVEGTEAKDRGEAEWRLRLPPSVTVDRLELLVDSKTFQSGAVRLVETIRNPVLTECYKGGSFALTRYA